MVEGNDRDLQNHVDISVGQNQTSVTIVENVTTCPCWCARCYFQATVQALSYYMHLESKVPSRGPSPSLHSTENPEFLRL